jgi:hypothetical protein
MRFLACNFHFVVERRAVGAVVVGGVRARRGAVVSMIQ